MSTTGRRSSSGGCWSRSPRASPTGPWSGTSGNLAAEPRYIALEYLDGNPLVDAFGTGSLGPADLYDFNTAVRRSEPVETRFGADQFKTPELLADAGADADAPVGGHSDTSSAEASSPFTC